VRTEQIKRTAKELIKRFPDKFSNDFEKNKHLVKSLVHGGTPKVLNQIAGYITRFMAAEQKQMQQETSEEADLEETESAEKAPEGA
jgi:small subunit ribosomal protein S17e